MNRNLAIAIALFVIGLLVVGNTPPAHAGLHHGQHLCSTRAYPRLHDTIRAYDQTAVWHSECSRWPVRIHRLLHDPATNPHYRRWLIRFIHTHGGIPYGDLLLGS